MDKHAKDCRIMKVAKQESKLINDIVALHNSMHCQSDENIGFRFDLRKLMEKHAPKAVERLNNSDSEW